MRPNKEDPHRLVEKMACTRSAKIKAESRMHGFYRREGSSSCRSKKEFKEEGDPSRGA
jgi:hypothetical protein